MRGLHSLAGMPSKPVDERSAAASLAALAVQLKEAAADAGRSDVAAKAEEAIALLAGADAGSPAGAGESLSRDDKANAALRFLDGLGF